VRTGLRLCWSPKTGWQSLCGTSNGREAVEKAGILKPDVAVLDIGMPLLNGVRVHAPRSGSSLPETEILILTMHDSEQLVQEVLAAGAHGYILKEERTQFDRCRRPRRFAAIEPYLSSGYPRLPPTQAAFRGPRGVRGSPASA